VTDLTTWEREILDLRTFHARSDDRRARPIAQSRSHRTSTDNRFEDRPHAHERVDRRDIAVAGGRQAQGREAEIVECAALQYTAIGPVERIRIDEIDDLVRVGPKDTQKKVCPELGSRFDGPPSKLTDTGEESVRETAHYIVVLGITDPEPHLRPILTSKPSGCGGPPRPGYATV
jgi:hypothetical protein